ncbi:MAG: D-alanyl-D-alanine carboxypeptidase family protein [Bacillaceae bacterium]
MIKKLVIGLGISLISVMNMPFHSVQAETVAGVTEKVYGEYGIAVSAKDGEVLYSKQGMEKAYPASITKVMTAILLVDYVSSGSWLTASNYAVSQEASNSEFLLKAGEQMTRDEALEALMVLSSNDVAAMIGEYISGTEERFGELMTRKAKELGSKNTNFVNASGLHDPNHYTTAYDMALIFKELMKYPEITKYMKTNVATIETNERTVDVMSPTLTHQYKELAYGKIGWTPEAGNTFIALVKDKGQEVISVVMQSKKPRHYTDTITMGEYGASQLSADLVRSSE